MKLVDMARTPAEQQEEAAEAMQPASMEAQAYPYGPSLTLCDDVLTKLGMDALPTVGATCNIQAVGRVTTVRQSASDTGGEYRSVEIQITQLGLDTQGKSAAEKIYGNSSTIPPGVGGGGKSGGGTN